MPLQHSLPVSGRDQPGLAWIGADSVEAPDWQVLQTALHSTVQEAVRPYDQTDTNQIDTVQLSLFKLSYLGNRFVQLRQFSKAILFFEKGLKVDSANDSFYAGLTKAYLRSGHRAAARNALLQATRVKPSRAIYTKLADKLNGKPILGNAGEKMMTFRLPDYTNAQHVTLAGSFNGWNDFTDPMQWVDGAWITTVPLSKGIYKYKFVVDGVWITDTRNPKFTPGSFDSELVVE